MTLTTTDSNPAFFSLPREVRDLIYDFAFGNDQLCFQHRGYVVVLSKGPPQSGAGAIHGLPLWLLTCHLICHEGIDALLQTRFFSPCCRPDPTALPPRDRPGLDYQLHGQLPVKHQRQEHQVSPVRQHAELLRCSDSVSNSLFLHTNSVRNLALSFPAAYSSKKYDNQCYHADRNKHYLRTYYSFGPRRFLAIFHPFVVANPCLSLEWDPAFFWLEVQAFTTWPKMWTGRFLRVDITFPMPDSGYPTLKDSAEAVARNLVNDDGSGTMRMKWKVDAIYHDPPLPGCSQHGEFCSNRSRRRRMSNVSQHSLRMTR